MRGEPARAGRAIALGILVLLLLAAAYNGLYEGINATHYADTPGMRVATVTQLLYGVTGLAALCGLLFRQQWVRWAVLGCFVAATLTALLAPVVYGGESVKIGILSGAIAALILGVVFWAWRRSSRPIAKNP